MTKTVTLHVGGGRTHRTHNARRYKRGQTPDHIAPHRRGMNETLIDLDHRQAYRDLFGEAVADYNAKQARPYALPALRWAVEQKLLSGKGGGLLDPTGPTTRAQLAAILLNLRAPAGPSPFSAGEP